MTAAEIIARVAAAHGLTPADLKGRRNPYRWADARAEAMRRVRTEATKTPSATAIGRLFGGRDHTTVLRVIRRHAARHGALAPLDGAAPAGGREARP